MGSKNAAASPELGGPCPGCPSQEVHEWWRKRQEGTVEAVRLTRGTLWFAKEASVKGGFFVPIQLTLDGFMVAWRYDKTYRRP